MKVVHADDQQPTLVGLGDTQQIREIGPPTDERVAPRQTVESGFADPRRDRHRSCSSGGRPRHGRSLLCVLARRRRGSPGPNRRPGRHRATRNPRRARAAGAGRGHGPCRSEGGNGAHGLAGPSRRHRGGWCSGARWRDRGNWGERHGRREHDDTGNSGALGNRPACGHERHRHCDLSSGSICARGRRTGLGSGSFEQERCTAILIPNEHQRMARRGFGNRSTWHR